MTLKAPRTPRLPEPLPAVLAGAGFFFFMAALTGLGPFGSLDRWLWRSASADQGQPLALTALRVLGSPAPASGTAKADALAADVAWLRSAGAGAIVLEAWLDEEPQADARAFAADLRARFEALPAGRGREQALQALSATAAGLDAPSRLAKALGSAQPLLLAFEALPGPGAPLPAPFLRQAYVVTLRGELKTLPVYQPLHLPFAEALDAVGRAGAVPPASDDPGRVAAAVSVDGHWYNGLGLEAARLALGLPLDGLHYRWRKGVLSSLELVNVRYPLDPDGRLLLPPQGPSLPQTDIDRLRRDPVQAAGLRGKLVFFRPWPKQLGDAQAFEDQARLFTAVVERNVLMPEAPAARRVEWDLLWAIGVVALAFAPAWAALAAWLILPLTALLTFASEPQAVALPLVLALSSLALGLGWRLQRRQSQRRAAEGWLMGKTGQGHLLGWRRRLRKGSASLAAAYAVVGPRSRLQGPDWEAWMERWGALLDETQIDAQGLIWADPGAKKVLLEALLDLRQNFGGVKAVLAQGTLSFRLEQQLGAAHWVIQGPPKDRAVDAFRNAKSGQLVLSKLDLAAYRELPECKDLEAAGILTGL